MTYGGLKSAITIEAGFCLQLWLTDGLLSIHAWKNDDYQRIHVQSRGIENS